MKFMPSKGPLISLSLAIVFNGLPVLAQGSQEQMKRLGSTTHHVHQNIDAMKVPPELPSLPTYSGQTKFLRGSVQTSDKDTTVYQMSFMTKDDPSRVKEWFDSALPSMKWKIISSGERNITAKHEDGHFCSIMVNDANRPRI